MSEETEPIEPLMRHELVEFVDSCIFVIQTLNEIDSLAALEDKDDIATLRKNSYKTIYAIQRAMLKMVKG